MNTAKTLPALLALAFNVCAPFVVNAESSGTLDSTLAPAFGPSFANGAFACAVQPDGRILVGGDFNTINNQTAYSLGRLSATGTLDTSFTSNPGANGTVRALVPLPDGKVLVGGEFTTINGASWRGLARLTSSGSPDPAFSSFSGVGGGVAAIAIQSDGKIIAGGSFSSANGSPRSYLARFTATGALDTTFTPLLDGMVTAVAVRSSGKILVGGSFQNVNNASKPYIVQLNSDGSTDTSFTTTLDWYVNSIALQTNGQAIIGGWFGYVNGAAQNYIARLNSNGSRDSTFTANSSGVIYTVAVQPNGKILAGGSFAQVNGTSKKNLVLLNSNGLVDPNFNTGTGPDSTVRSVALQADGKILIGGDFKYVSMVPRTYVARIWGDPPPPVAPADNVQIWTAVEIGWSSQAGTNYQVQWSSEASPAVWQNLGDSIAGTGSHISVFDSTRSNGRRFYRVVKIQ